MPPTSTYADEALHSPRNQEASGSALVDDEDVIEISSDESEYVLLTLPRLLMNRPTYIQ